MRYAPHERLVASARAFPALWRVILGAALAMAVYLGLVYTAFGLVARLRGPEIAASLFEDVFVTGRSAGDALWLLASFACLLAGTLTAARLLHRRGLRSLTGPPGQALADFAGALRALALLYAALWLLLPAGTELAPNLSPGRWLALLPLAIPALILQTGAEEIFFRGYLQQQLAARFHTPLLWIGLPTLAFAYGHYAPDQAGPNALPAVAWAGLFAIAAADLTARTGTLGAAVAFHFANNATSVLLVALPGPVSGLALYTYPFGPADPEVMPLLLVDLALIAVSWLAIRVALRV